MPRISKKCATIILLAFSSVKSMSHTFKTLDNSKGRKVKARNRVLNEGLEDVENVSKGKRHLTIILRRNFTDLEEQRERVLSSEVENQEDPEETDPESCNRNTKWTPCSKYCGLGMQVRYVPDYMCLDFQRETRLCHDRFCLPPNPFPNDLNAKRGFADEYSRRLAEEMDRKAGKGRKVSGKRSKKGLSYGHNPQEIKITLPKNNHQPKSKRQTLKFCRNKKNILIRPKKKSKISYAGCTSRKEYKLNFCTDACGAGKQQTCCQKHKVKQVKVKFYCEIEKLMEKKEKLIKQKIRLENSLREPDEEEIKYDKSLVDGYYGNCKSVKSKSGRSRSGRNNKGKAPKYCTFIKSMELIKHCKCSKKSKCSYEDEKVDRKLIYNYDLTHDRAN